MENNYSISGKFKLASYILIGVGVIALIYGFFINSERAFANILLNNYYFISLAIGASFFLAIQYITQSGWSAMFKRIPEAMGSYLPVGAVFMLVLLAGISSLYQWTHTDLVAVDGLLQHKSPYLNIPFFIARMVAYFAIWIIMIRLLRRESLIEDQVGGIEHFNKSEFYSKIFIFTLAVTFSLATFDWIMSIDAHWYSTIFAVKDFVSAFYHACAVITLVVILLHEKGYFKLLNESHLHDFSRYMFMLGIMWAYFWFCQFLLIWYGNLPEETIYYVARTKIEWSTLFYANIILNWAIPFSVLIFNKADRSKLVLKIICIILIIGQWVDLYIQVTPGIVGEMHIGFIEVGTFLGFIGLFALVVGTVLSKASIIPKNHPYLKESMHHEIHL